MRVAIGGSKHFLISIVILLNCVLSGRTCSFCDEAAEPDRPNDGEAEASVHFLWSS